MILYLLSYGAILSLRVELIGEYDLVEDNLALQNYIGFTVFLWLCRCCDLIGDNLVEIIYNITFSSSKFFWKELW